MSEASVEARARELLASIFDEDEMPVTADYIRQGKPVRFTDYSIPLRAIIAALTQSNASPEDAAEEEREVCAKLAGDWESSLKPGSVDRLYGHQEARKAIAAAIRARKPASSEGI